MKRSVFVGSAIAVVALRPSSAVAVTPGSRSTKIAMMAVAASMIELPPAWICEIIFAAELAAEALCDPPPCRVVRPYAALAVPAPSAGLVRVDARSLAAIFTGRIGPPTAGLYQRAVDAQAAVAADEIAVSETVNRRFTARQHRDEAAFARQQQQLAALIRRTAADKQRANAAWSAFSAYAKEAGLVDKRRTSPAQALLEVGRAGFSPPKVAVMRRLGMTDAHIALVRSLVANTHPVSFPASFVAAVPTIIGLNTHNADIAACSCRPLQEPRR